MKLSNLITQDIIEKNKNDITIISHEFDEIIVAKNDIKNISKHKINLLLDFLKHIKQLSSKIILRINLNQFNPFPEFLNEFKFNKNSEDENGLLQIIDINNIVFNEEKQENEEKNNSNLDKIFSKYIRKFESKEKEENENCEFIDYFKDDKNSLTEERLERILSGKYDTEEIKISNLLKILRIKLKENEEIKKLYLFSKISFDENYFYNTWKKTFYLYPYKKEEKFKEFVNVEKYPISLDEIKEIIKNLISEKALGFI